MVRIPNIVPNENMEYTKVLLGNYPVEIMSYKSILQMELKVRLDNDVINPYQYVSAFYNNIGYSNCPNISSLEGIDISLDKLYRNTVVDYPITKYPVMFNRTRTTLRYLLNVIKTWCKGTAKRGHILDTKNSNDSIPSNLDIRYMMENNIIIKPLCSTTLEEYTWDSSDIRMTRLHNLSLNKNYFYNSFKYFNLIEDIMIYNPYAVFAMALINPDVIYSFIRSSEIEAATRVNCNGYFILRKDKDMKDIFARLLNNKIFYLANLYYKYGFEALWNIHMNYIKNNSPVDYYDMKCNMNINIVPDYAITKSGEYDDFAILSLEDKYKFIDNIVIRNEEKNFIFKYIDKENLPDILQKKVVYNDGSQTYSKLYIDTLKRLWVSLKQIECYHPEYLESGSKLLLSDSFYIDNTRFVLYNTDMNIFIVLTNTFNSFILNKDDTIKFYRDNYGMNIVIDSEEINTESIEVADFNIEEFSKNYELYYGNNNMPKDTDIIVSNNSVVKEDNVIGGVSKVQDKDINTHQTLLSDGFEYNIENMIDEIIV
jgi:hypothetical protein